MDGHSTHRVSPTDIAQFIRLDQCERFLRLRLFGRTDGMRFMREYDVTPQSIPPLLSRSGSEFEQQIERAVADRYWKIDFVEDLAHMGQRSDDNDRVVALARDLEPGEIAMLFQPRLYVDVHGWWIRGDVDILRLERDSDGELHILIADMKSTTTAKVEHRLQVAFYLEMLSVLLERKGVVHTGIELGILYRGPGVDGDGSGEDPVQVEAEYAAAERYFGTREGRLEIVADAENYRGSVADLVTGPESTAARVMATPFEDVPFHLNYKCDGCMFNEFCMKWSAEADDLSLLPAMTLEDKNVLHRKGVTTVTELAALKELGPTGAELATPPAKQSIVQELSVSWPVGPRLDELIHRARRYRRWKGDDLRALSYIPSKGYGSLPYTDAQHNPNLVRVYIDAQHDYLHDRIYLLGALVVACEHGQESSTRRRSIVHLAARAPETPEIERDLLVRWVEETVRAVVELAAPDPEGQPRAPIHLIFYNRFEQNLLLEGLARHFTTILGATPLYDFVTQLAAYDSPIATFLDAEIRELKNYPMVCQSLQAVAAYLRFDWNAGTAYRDLFHARMFDFWRKFEWDPAERAEKPWYTARARFSSQIPLEYAYAAWDALPAAPTRGKDDFSSYRQATPDLLAGFHARRLEALEHITHDFSGNKQTEKRAFDLPDLATFIGKAGTLAEALDEFVTIERHVDLAAWKSALLAPPERRVLTGETLIARYCPEDQEPEALERNRENIRRFQLKEQYRAASPDGTLSKDQKKEVGWSQEGMKVVLRLETAGVDCDLREMLLLCGLGEGERVVVSPRFTVDSRLPLTEQYDFTPTPRQMLYSPRATLAGIRLEPNAAGIPSACCELEMVGSRGGAWSRGFAFGSMDRPFEEGTVYTLDPDPNDWYGYFCARVVEELCSHVSAGGPSGNTLYARLQSGDEAATVAWPPAAAEAQERFLAGIDAIRSADDHLDFESSKRDYIARHGDAPVLLVQGPPGTGKSYSTAFALFARLQGALVADRECRAFLSCKTHAATNVLLDNVVEVQELLRTLAARDPATFERYFDRRLLDIPLFRGPTDREIPSGVTALYKADDRPKGAPLSADVVTALPHCVVAITPGGTYRMLKDKWSGGLSGHHFCHCLVLDEASQMNLPEAVMAALPLAPDGQLIVVGDHRQMPPIVKHDWANEPRRTFSEFRSYESLFLALLPLNPPMIKFAQSFRLHADMAEFLRREIYHLDGIDYFSDLHDVLPDATHDDPFIAAVLSPRRPIIVVVHDEEGSLFRNTLERELIVPLIAALAGEPYHLTAEHGFGVVVPHTAQRADLRRALGDGVVDAATGKVVSSPVDTVERFQGDERTAILVGATESDRSYLLISSDFLLDPRRLTVALSRAKRKMVLIASRSVFNLFSADEETFAHAQLWKNLLRHTATDKLWEGERCGHKVVVWGNVPSDHQHESHP